MDIIESGVKEPVLPKSKVVPPPPKVVIVDIGERQSPEDVKSLRHGEGKLIDHVERIMADLVAAGTVGSLVQPVVFVIRETSSPVDEEDEDDDD